MATGQHDQLLAPAIEERGGANQHRAGMLRYGGRERRVEFVFRRNHSCNNPNAFQDTRSAGVVGGGIEYMLTQNWTVRVEGLHSNFGTSPITTISGFGGHYQSKFTDSLTVVRGALNWKW